jgi:hypothetical protein
MLPIIRNKNFYITSPTGGGRSVGIVRSRTKAKEFSFNQILDGKISHKEWRNVRASQIYKNKGKWKKNRIAIKEFITCG